MSRLKIDLDKAAEIYLESSEAQHGDPEMARWDAELWLRIFNEVLWLMEHEAFEEST